ncbi:TPT-domain-containing protein [Pseudovirgaria hyperparasitica]|uniref:TPT-domain-containing protein n=1 Tax=Pseudovirgaria hyperparasitica TaxID=470096 RepID=A0A6A6WD29_9PEZI|nr:TPT-domain-containing protein [Pseudovirgaria hyperparasitica]KAF2759964.1 TPT-domain-containing protein [Pseudovirgaria hyperparasitica]
MTTTPPLLSRLLAPLHSTNLNCSSSPILSPTHDHDHGHDHGLPLTSYPSHSSSDSANIRRLPHRHLLTPSSEKMGGDGTHSHARRRSSSLASVASVFGQGSLKPSSKRPRRKPHNSGNIPEDDEEAYSDDYVSGSANSAGSGSDGDTPRSDDGLEDDEETGLTGKERQKRRRRKRRNTHLDERIAGDTTISHSEAKLARRVVIREVVINTVLICLWYLFSVAISLYNKWMFKDDSNPDKPNIFPYPLFTTCLHQVVQFTLASLVLFIFPSLRPRNDSINSHNSASARQDSIDPKKPLMTKWFYITRIGPCGIGNALDIGLGNMSLKFISLTFFTMCKSSALGFVLIFAFLFRLEKPSWKLVGIIATMTVGVIMMVFGETAFRLLGFILVMTASCASGFRWSLTQILLLRNPATSNPFSTSFFLAPVMFVCLLVLALPVEGVPALMEGLHTLMEARGKLMGVLILLFPGCLAFCMTVSEFALLKRTSVVTLSICGIFKEVVMITTASLVFEDTLTPVNISGLIITIASIGTYNWIKIKQMNEDARRDAHLAAVDYQPVLSSEPSEDSRSGSDLPPRQTTRHLINHSLSIPAGQLFPSPQPPMVDSPARASPVKRPENLD